MSPDNDTLMILTILMFQHNMSTAMDKDAIKEAYTEVMADSNGIEW